MYPNDFGALPITPDGSQEYFWKTLMTQDHIGMLNKAIGDEQYLQILLRHFWNRAFAFHKNWTAIDQYCLMEQVLVGVNRGNRPHICSLLDEACIEAKEKCIMAVEEFARLWLAAPKGLKYMSKLKILLINDLVAPRGKKLLVYPYIE